MQLIFLQYFSYQWVSASPLYPPQGPWPEQGLSREWCFIYSGVHLNLFIILGHVRFPSCVSQVDRSAGNWNSLYARASLYMWADCAKSTIVLPFAGLMLSAHNLKTARQAGDTSPFISIFPLSFA